MRHAFQGAPGDPLSLRTSFLPPTETRCPLKAASRRGVGLPIMAKKSSLLPPYSLRSKFLCCKGWRGWGAPSTSSSRALLGLRSDRCVSPRLLDALLSSPVHRLGVLMNFQFRLLFMLTVGCMFVAPKLSAQDPTRLAGRITSSAGQPLLGAFIIIPSMNIGVASNSDGRYVLIVPASRATGQTVEMSVSMIGRATEAVQVTPSSGHSRVRLQPRRGPPPARRNRGHWPGARNTAAQKLGVTINTVRAEEIALSHEPNIVAALAGKAPNVEVTSSGGDPGAGSYIRIRGANSLIGSNQAPVRCGRAADHQLFRHDRGDPRWGRGG